MSGLAVGLVGATGVVGEEMRRGLETASIPVESLTAYAGTRGAGRELDFRGTPVTVLALDETTFRPLDLVLMSAGSAVSRVWAPRWAATGAVVVDNSSAFRRDPTIPLVVPEVNRAALQGEPGIVANPNCSTIQMVVALAPLHRRWGLARVRVATYQAASGAGSRAQDELWRESAARLEGRAAAPEVFPRTLGFNVIPQVGPFDEAGESEEERKMRDETRRLLDLPDLPVSATCVRVPVARGHSEAVWAEFTERPDPVEAMDLLRAAGVVCGKAAEDYPTPRDADGHRDVLVGRVRRDPSDPHALGLWIVADNLLKGAATNALQIAECLLEDGRLGAARR